MSKSDPRKHILEGLLLMKENNWEAAHEIAQSREGHPDYDRLHAYLHRVEGDEWNAKYWYRRIGLPYPSISLDVELEDLILIYSA
jgi:hypothetical protein